MTKQEMMNAITACAEKLGRAPTQRELQKMTVPRLERTAVMRRFGSYTRALEACGLARADKGRPHRMMDLFVGWATLARKLKRIPTSGEYCAETGITTKVLLKFFRKWSELPEGMIAFMGKEKLEPEWSDVAEILRRHMATKAQKPAESAAENGEKEEREAAQPGKTEAMGAHPGSAPMSSSAGKPARSKNGLPLFGAPIQNEVMAHAPVNEHGVLALFVAMARQLGFVILHVQPGFPDVLAMRRVGGDRWQLVRIELEFESKNFRGHFHDPDGCDLIVCWKHNWKGCPVEVVELSKFFSN